ncbi:hypothetical protein M405DRAFT_732940 [Rhizopogon salebrosus TDB-379]|nr:hypothetical protein M405DRAFT_732940 [Rhizopogon salebrosus TDB-379]
MPKNNVQALLSTDIPDPSDFPRSDLRQLDASLRCTICGELYDAPITLACGHCFCSLCIREHITKESECPSCRKSTNDGQFRINPVLEEAYSSSILRLSREEQDRVRRYQEQQTPRRTKTPHTNYKKRKRSSDPESSDSDIVEVAGPSTPQSRSRSSRRRDMEPSSDPREEEIEQGVQIVNCPICNVSVLMEDVNTHIDSGCKKKMLANTTSTSKLGAKDQWSKIWGSSLKQGKDRVNGNDADSETERIPKVSYDVLKDKQLKDLLQTHTLSTHGDRKTWIARHRRWVMIFNANLDKCESNRKSAQELRHELKKWEDDRKGRKHLVDDTEAHLSTNHGEFSRLIAEARKSKVKNGTSSMPVEQHPQDDHTIVADSEEDEKSPS